MEPADQSDMEPARADRDMNGDPETAKSTEGVPDLEPMSASLLGRLFAVPFLIVGAVVGGAVIVVLLFGGPAAAPERPIAELLQVLEAQSGERNLGVLLPREKELWQTALELSVRLGNKDKEADLTDETLASTATRLAGMIRDDLAHFDALPSFGKEKVVQVQVRARRIGFLIHALGRTGRPEAVDPLIEIVRAGRSPFSQVAMQELGELHALPGTQEAIEPIADLLETSTTPETMLVASTVLSVLAKPDDQRVIDVLARTRLNADAEVDWSTSLALARLGSDAGKPTLMDLLDRTYLESGKLYRVSATGEANQPVKHYQLPAGRVEEILIATINAAAHLDDADLWEMIERLKSDPSPTVRARAQQVVKAEGRPATGNPAPSPQE